MGKCVREIFFERFRVRLPLLGSLHRLRTKRVPIMHLFFLRRVRRARRG